MNKRILVVFISITLATIPTALAAPDIQIHSPQNTTYSNSNILLNVTSNETVDFSIEGEDSMVTYFAYYRNNFSTYLYAKSGTFNLTVWANNSNGTSAKSVVFTIDQPSNPITVTTCGYLVSPDTEYILGNNVTNYAQEGSCIIVAYAQNISFDLNEKRVTGQETGVIVQNAPYTQVFNGDIYARAQDYYAKYGGSMKSVLPIALIVGGCKYNFKDLNIHGFIGYNPEVYTSVSENLYINASCGIRFGGIGNSIIKDSTIEFNGLSWTIDGYESVCNTSAFVDTFLSELILENVTINNFPYDFTFSSYFSDYFTRNTNIDESQLLFKGSWSEIRLYKQHLAIINVTDQDGIGVPSILNITDSGCVPRMPEEDTKYIAASNPTSQILVPTDENGVATTWLVEKLNFYRVASPLEEEEYMFSPYEVKAVSRNVTNTTQLDIQGNSTFTLDVGLTFAEGEGLPACTLQQMLDLNGDETVDVNDAIFILRYITGLSVDVDTTKSCEGITLQSIL